MKKTSLFIFLSVCVLFAGCTSKEQDEKIKAFWFGQLFDVMTKASSFKQPAAMPLPVSFAKSAAARPSVSAHPQTAKPVNQPVKPADPVPPSIMDVTMDDAALPGKAAYNDRVRMKQDWTALQLNNQAALKDLQATFGDNVKDKAFYIMLSTEQKLKQAAYMATDYNAYNVRQQNLLQEQNKALAQLMEQNKASIRHLK